MAHQSQFHCKQSVVHLHLTNSALNEAQLTNESAIQLSLLLH